MFTAFFARPKNIRKCAPGDFAFSRPLPSWPREDENHISFACDKRRCAGATSFARGGFGALPWLDPKPVEGRVEGLGLWASPHLSHCSFYSHYSHTPALHRIPASCSPATYCHSTPKPLRSAFVHFIDRPQPLANQQQDRIVPLLSASVVQSNRIQPI